jgi:hypothetical protein
MYDAREHICFNVGRVMRKVYEHYDSRLAPCCFSNLANDVHFLYLSMTIVQPGQDIN